MDKTEKHVTEFLDSIVEEASKQTGVPAEELVKPMPERTCRTCAFLSVTKDWCNRYNCRKNLSSKCDYWIPVKILDSETKMEKTEEPKKSCVQCKNHKPRLQGFTCLRTGFDYLNYDVCGYYIRKTDPTPAEGEVKKYDCDDCIYDKKDEHGKRLKSCWHQEFDICWTYPSKGCGHTVRKPVQPTPAEACKKDPGKAPMALLDFGFLEAVARHWGEGLKKNGREPFGWMKIENTPANRREIESALLRHFAVYRAGDQSEDHLAAVVCNANILWRMMQE